MSLYQHTPPLVIFKKSALFASILLALSSQVHAQGWTYDENSLWLERSDYYYTWYKDDSVVNPVFNDGFVWDKDSVQPLTEEQLKNIANIYGIKVVLYSNQTPSLTFKNFSASISGFKSPNAESTMSGIYANATDLNFNGSVLISDIGLSFDDIELNQMLTAIDADPTNLSITDATISMNKISSNQGSLEIRGLGAGPLKPNSAGSRAEVNKTGIVLSNSVAELIKGLYVFAYKDLSFQENSINLDNVTASSIRGFYSEDNGNVVIHKNNMSVTGGTFETLSAISVADFSDYLESVDITDNHLTLTNVNSPNAAIVGVQLENYKGQDYEGINVTGNTVSLKDSTIESLIVAYSDDGASRHFFNSGNTTKFAGVNTIKGELAGFDRMEYDVSAANEKDAVLTLNSSVQNSFDDTTIKVNKGTDVQDGINYKLIAAVGSSAKFTNTTVESDATFVHSEWNVGDFTLKDGETLSVRWGEAQDPEDPTDTPVLDPDDPTDTPVLDPDNPSYQTATENSKTLSESLLGTVAFLNQGAEFIADEGLAAMVDSAKLGELSAFGAVHGGTSNYKTGSRVDVDGYTLAAGGSIKLSPEWVVGGFIEAGWADSDGHVGHAKGEGDHDYYGVGLATRYMLNDAWYVDGSLRVGQASTEFTGLYAGDSAKYDSDAFYVTAHAGTGYLFNLTDSVNLDVYGRYLVTYLDGDNVRLHNKYDDKFDMDSTVTHAIRVGGRLTGSFCPYAGWKVGLAYEHVFDGDAESTVNSLNLEVPSLEGDTGVMEVGVTMKPSLNSRWSMDLGAKGYAGDREGVTGSVMVRYAF